MMKNAIPLGLNGEEGLKWGFRLCSKVCNVFTHDTFS